MVFCCGAREVASDKRAEGVKVLPGPVEELEQLLGDRLQRPGGLLYDAARGDPDASLGGVEWDGEYRQTWNLDVIGHPSAIATVNSAAEVQAVVKYAKQHCLGTGVLLCVASGRHSHQCMQDDSLVVDLQRLSHIEVDAAKRTAKVSAGAQQGSLDAACAPFNLATTAGHNASTGCGGLILQGGHGFLERKFGMVVDNLLAAEVVLADGSLVEASDKKNPDLLWALKGGGGNFGIVVSFTLRLHELGDVYAGQRVHVPLGLGPMKSREELITQLLEKTLNGPAEATGLMVLPCGGPVIEMLLWVGAPEDGRSYFESKHVGYPLLKNDMGIKKYHTEVQRFYPPGNHVAKYQSGVMLPEVPSEAIDKLADMVTRSKGPNSQSGLILLPLGGQVSTVAPEATAYAHRSMKCWVLIDGTFSRGDLTERARVVQWVQDVKAALLPFTKGASYGVLSEVQKHDCDAAAANGSELNGGEERNPKDATAARRNIDDNEGGAVGIFMNTLESVGTRNIFGVNLPRLQQLKLKYDPDNLFRATDNILPESKPKPTRGCF